MAAMATAFRIGETNTWAAKVPLKSRDEKDRAQSRTPMALHFVIDNSGSMGHMTKEVVKAFSSLVDSASSKPCSLTLFSHRATILSSSIKTTQQMLDLPDLPQGQTNIPAGVQAAVDVITRREEEKFARCIPDKTHHVLILLTDGCHNAGPEPSREFPKIGKQLFANIPDVQLSVVLVGITRNSSTSMGMLLKTSLETVPLDADTVKTIYFASTQSQVQKTAENLVEGLNSISTGAVHTVSHPEAKLISDIGFGFTPAITFRATNYHNSSKTILIESEQLPDHIVVDGEKVDIVNTEMIDHEVIEDALKEHIDKIKIKRVASADPVRVRAAIEQLQVLIDALGKELSKKEGAKLKLAHVRGSDRLAQNRQLLTTVNVARELRNQLSDVENFRANSSEEQAAFLTGGKSKFASKALKRAAARSTDGTVLDPEKEMSKVCKEIVSTSFVEDITSRLRVDTMTHLARLSKAQLLNLETHVKRVSAQDFNMLRQIATTRILCAFRNETHVDPTSDDTGVLSGLSRALQEFVDSGSLAGYLNEVFFGRRQSYLSLASPWEHLSEWRELVGSNVAFKSQWEMLLYLGSVACPISVERSAAAQMDPFQLTIKKIHTTVVDTASLCCSNHSEIDTYGPEGGEPIKDALVLVDPSCPRASVKILSTALLGETYTSVVVSRDLHMYTGASMKIALLANSLFRCLQPEAICKAKPEVLAEIRRQFLGKSYQCRECGFGPVDHGGCSDLLSHHGEHRDGGVASNACPSCGWFSECISDWDQWDGTVPDSLIPSGQGQDRVAADKPLYSKMDMVLRILYSFRKQFSGRNNPIKQQYQEYAQRLVAWDLSFTTTDGVQALVQILIAVMACDDEIIDDVKGIEAAFAPPVVLAIVNEACARAARKKFRMASGGDESKTKDITADYVTKMLGVTKASAPVTKESLLESEPDRSVVMDNCSRDYDYDWNRGDEKEEIAWAKKIAIRWCRMFEMAKGFRLCLAQREGGWEQLERDMETSLESYQDVVEALQNTGPCDSSLACKMCDIDMGTANRTWTTMAAQAFLCNKGSSRLGLKDVRCGETLRDIARDMRMRIYEHRVKEKMKVWADEGQQLAFFKARACDIGQYYNMLGGSIHVHGLSKEMFWGLWEAAIYDGHRGEKVEAFLMTANDGFCYKHAPPR